MKKIFLVTIAMILLTGCSPFLKEEKTNQGQIIKELNEKIVVLEDESKIKDETILNLQNELQTSKDFVNNKVELNYELQDGKRIYMIQSMGISLELPNDLPKQVKVKMYVSRPRVEVFFETSEKDTKGEPINQLIVGYSIELKSDILKDGEINLDFIAKDLGNGFVINEFTPLDLITTNEDLQIWDQYKLSELKAVIK